VRGSNAHIQHELAQLRVKFGHGTSTVLAGDASQAVVLSKLADLVKGFKGTVKVLLEGHREDAEIDGSDVERCQAVFQYLVEGALCPASGLRVRARGAMGGEGCCVIPVPMDELVVTAGPLNPSLEATNPGVKPGIFFDANQAALTQEATSILQKLAERIDEDDSAVLVEAHTDKVEQTDLAIKRAQAVSNALVKFGVSPKLLRLKACGNKHPSSQLHDALNRRVEFYTE